MKRLLSISICLLIATIAFAQTQQGYVKTKGRMVNGQLVPGQGLQGAIVSVQGRTPILVNTADGAFSFPTTQQLFQLDSVKKKGYQLVDMEACSRTYKYSPNPLYIVMETPEQQLQDKLNAERKIRRNLQKQLQAKEEEIEALKNDNKISMAEYQEALQKIYDEQESNEQLITSMAKRYSELDYDQLDEFYRQISYCIENGELTKADSLLRTRGDVTAQVNTILQRGQIIKEQKEQLQKAENVQKADVEEAARRCYSFFETFYLQHQNDSAANYLILRARLDTTNIESQNDAGQFLVEFLSEYDKAIPYYQTALRQAEAQYGENSAWAATIYNNLGMNEYYKDNYQKALEYFNIALNIRTQLFGPNHPEVATAYNSIGLINNALGDYDQALEHFIIASEIRVAAFGENDPNVAETFNNIGYIYYVKGDFDTALTYLNKALDIKTKTMDEYDPKLITTHANLGSICLYASDYENAMYHFNKAYEISKISLGEYHPTTATSVNNIGMAYSFQKDYEKALEYINRSLMIQLKVTDENHPKIAQKYANIGNIYSYLGDIDKSLEYFGKALAINLKILGEDHPEVANIYYNMGQTYFLKEDYDSTLEYLGKAKTIWEKTFGPEDAKTLKAKKAINTIETLMQQKEKEKEED